MLPGEMAFPRIVTKGISHMGTTFFLLFVATCLGSALFVLRRINSSSYLFGQKCDAVEHEQVRTAKRRPRPDEEVEHPRVSVYVDWYFKNSVTGTDKHGKTFVGNAYMANEEIGQISRMGRQAVH